MDNRVPNPNVPTKGSNARDQRRAKRVCWIAGLGGKLAAASFYQSSPRPYTGALRPIEYPRHFIVKRVTNGGTICFKKHLVLIANALKQHPIGLEEVADGVWSASFCRVLLARIDERDYIIRA